MDSTMFESKSNRPVAFICPNVEGYLNWMKNPFPEIVNSFPEWTHTINSRVVYGDNWRKTEDEMELSKHHKVVVIIANPIRSKAVKSIMENIKAADHGNKIVLFIDGYLESCFDRARGWDFLWCLNNCDIVAANRIDSDLFFESLTDKPVRFLSFPVDMNYVREFSKPLASRDEKKIIVCAGSGSVDAIHIIRKRFPDFKFVLTNRGGFFTEAQLEYMGMLDYVSLEPKVNQAEFYRRASKCYLAVHLDYKGHLGRFATDMALLGIPCIGTSMTDRQKYLFKGLTINGFNNAPLINSFIVDLYGHSDYYEEICNMAYTNARTFSHKNSKVRWVELCSKIGVVYDNN